MPLKEDTVTTKPAFLTPLPAISDGPMITSESLHLVALRICPATEGRDIFALGHAPFRVEMSDWVAACYRLTPRVERVKAWEALLDLDICDDAEALAAIVGLVARLFAMGLRARAGIGPIGVLAQLARLTAPRDRPISLVAPAEATAFLRRVPVAVLSDLHPRGSIPPEIVERL
jgi:hypothetical protein